MQAYPLENVLRHTQHGVDRLDLLIAHEGKPRHPKQRVEGVHLRRRGDRRVRIEKAEACLTGSCVGA